jgi:hypothetical protein
MSDLLAIIDSIDTDEALLAEITRRHPARVTVLVETSDAHGAAGDDASRRRVLADRVANLLAAIEARTGAVVVGLVESREQLRGWRFDRIIGGHRPGPAF